VNNHKPATAAGSRNPLIPARAMGLLSVGGAGDWIAERTAGPPPGARSLGGRDRALRPAARSGCRDRGPAAETRSGTIGRRGYRCAW
jgi:hypothetical protein